MAGPKKKPTRRRKLKGARNGAANDVGVLTAESYRSGDDSGETSADMPAKVAKLLQSAVQKHQASQWAGATQLYHEVLQLDPQNPDALHLLGVIAHQAGDHSTAIELISAAIEHQPDVADFYLNLGTARLAMGDVVAAIEAFQKALQLNPRLTLAINNLANALKAKGDTAAALHHYSAALELEPNNAQVLCNRAALLIDTDLVSAESDLRRALQLNPELFEGYTNLAVVEARKKNTAEAIELYHQSLLLQPNSVKTWNNLGELLAEQGTIDEAKLCFQQAVEKSGQSFRLLRAETVCPVIPQSCEEIAQYRSRLDRVLEVFQDQSLDLDDKEWGASGLAPPYYLPYHGENDRTLKSKWASLFSSQIPSVDPIPRQGISHVGFVVADRHVPVFWRFMGGFLQHLPSEDLKVSVVGSEASRRELAAYPVSPSVGYVVIGKELLPAALAIQAAQIDVLFHFEPGADAFSYFLPFCKAAPVQCTSWGIPVTSGIPAMSDFISSRWLESESADEHYSETLWRFESLPVFYSRPKPHARKERSEFGFSDSDHLYGCLQSLFKLHPRFDDALAEILRADEQGKVVLLEGRQPHWTTLLKQRFGHSLADVADRVIFLPSQSSSDFLSLVDCCDVLLDPFPFGGGATTYEAMSVGTPTVTWPGEWMRGRVTSACWQRMGIHDWIASSLSDYVAKAIQIASDESCRTQLKSQILAANSVLFDDHRAVEELREWLLERA